MKSIVNRMVVIMMVAALTSVVALAKKQKVTFESDIKVNGTLVKKGTYDLKFNDETGQLSIMKGGKVIAEAMARVESRSKKANDFQMRSTLNGDQQQLTGITFGGSDKDVVISNGAGSTTGSSN